MAAPEAKVTPDPLRGAPGSLVETVPSYDHGWADVDGYRVHYLEAGTGDPVVLVHGFGGWAEVTWRHTLHALARDHRVIAPDLVGFGLSDRPRPDDDGAFTDALDPEERFLRALLDDLGVGPATLVGSSWGGGIALALALEHPEEVSRLVLVDSYGLGRGIHPMYRLAGLPWVAERLNHVARADVERFWDILTHPEVPVPRSVVDESLAFMERPGSARTLTLGVRTGVNLLGQRMVLADRLPEIQQPSLVVWGRDDPVFPLRHGVRAAERLPNGELAVVERCAHLPSFERPRAFNAILRRFLAENPVDE